MIAIINAVKPVFVATLILISILCSACNNVFFFHSEVSKQIIKYKKKWIHYIFNSAKYEKNKK